MNRVEHNRRGLQLDLRLPRRLVTLGRWLSLLALLLLLLGGAMFTRVTGGDEDSAAAFGYRIIDTASEDGQMRVTLQLETSGAALPGDLTEDWSALFQDGQTVAADVTNIEPLGTGASEQRVQVSLAVPLSPAGHPIAIRYDPDGQLGPSMRLPDLP